MKRDKWSSPIFTVEWGSHGQVALSARRFLALAVDLAGLLICACFNYLASSRGSSLPGFVGILSSAGLGITGAILGVVLAPTPKPTDFSTLAVSAFDDLSELVRANSHISDQLDEVSRAAELQSATDQKIRLALAQTDLARQTEMLKREISRWSQIAPGSEDEIVKGRLALAVILQKLEKGLPG